MTVAAIVLAAGASTRYGHTDKLLADLSGKPVVAHVLTAAAASRAGDIVLIVPDANSRLIEAAGDGRWRTIVNTDASSGMASSIRTGIASLPQATTGALILLADMPWINAVLIDRLIQTFETSNEMHIIFPASREGRQGHPVLFPKSVFVELGVLQGDTGARSVIEANAALARPVVVDTQAIFKDIDTEGDVPSA